MSSSVPAQKRALVSLLRELFPDAAVTYGQPTRLEAQMAWLGEARVTNGQPTSNGSGRRPRREEVEVDAVLSCYVAGNADPSDDAQMQATDNAYVMLDALEEHFRTVGSAPLATGCMSTIISKHEASQPVPATDSNDIVRGWTCNITATVSTTATV